MITRLIRSKLLMTLALGSMLHFVVVSCAKDEEALEEEMEAEEMEDVTPPAVADASEELAQAEGTDEEEVVEDSSDEAENEELTSQDIDSEMAPAGDSANTEVPKEAPEPSMPQADPSAMAETESIATGSEFPADGRVVMYVSKNTKLHQGANGPVAGSAQKGDHFVVVSVQNGWAQLDNGMSISESALTTKGVGRSRASNPWASK